MYHKSYAQKSRILFLVNSKDFSWDTVATRSPFKYDIHLIFTNVCYYLVEYFKEIYATLWLYQQGDTNNLRVYFIPFIPS